MIYTRTGDDLTTSAIGGQRVSKDAPIISFYGEIDSLNAMLGFAASAANHHHIREQIEREQRHLFTLPLLVSPNCKAHDADIIRKATATLEQEIDKATATLPPLTDFLLPGGTLAASAVGLARTQCRKAERALTSLHAHSQIAPECAAYINRLSDWLYTISRVLNKISNTEEKKLHKLSEIIN